MRAERDKAVARRRDALTGTSEFPDLQEGAATVLIALPPPSPLAERAGLGGPEGAVRLRRLLRPSCATKRPHPSPPCLPTVSRSRSRRCAMPPTAFWRRRASAKIFLANLGRVADFTARATYAKNFFEAGGIATVTNDGFAPVSSPGGGAGDAGATDLAALRSTFAESGAGFACLCASDDIYATDAAAAARILAAAGAAHIYLAGRPSELEDALRAAGVGTFIYVGCDVVAVLAAALAMIC